MEMAHCTNCGEDVRPVGLTDATEQREGRQACDCTEASRDAYPFEVDGWEWISYDG